MASAKNLGLCQIYTPAGYGWVCSVLFGESTTNAFLHRKDSGTRSWNEIRPRLFRDRVDHLRVTDRCDVHIDFLDFTFQRIWKEDLSSADQMPTDNALGWLDSALHLAPQFSHPGSFWTWASPLLRRMAPCLRHLGISVMTVGHPAKRQQQEQTTQPDKIAYAMSGKKILFSVSCSY